MSLVVSTISLMMASMWTTKPPPLLSRIKGDKRILNSAIVQCVQYVCALEKVGSFKLLKHSAINFDISTLN